MQEKIKQELAAVAEESYQIFAAKLIPQVNNLLGVRLPILRKQAKKIARLGYEQYLAIEHFDYFEEIMLQGMIIGYLEKPWHDKEVYIRKFIPKINNWSVCDSFCRGLKIKLEEKATVWHFLQPYFFSDSPYDIRFAIVMVIFYFADDNYAYKAFALFDQIKHDDYYVKMALAWAVSIFFRELPKITVLYLRKNKLNDWIFNKSLQKIIESLKTDGDTKTDMRLMKRKVESL